MYFLISRRFRFLMGWSAKCACSSIKRWYLDVHGIPMASLGGPVYKVIGYGDTEYTAVEWHRPQQYDDFRKFVLVRNPYSRVVSGFLNKYALTQEFPNHGWQTFNEFLLALRKDTRFRKVDQHHFCPQFSEAYPQFERAGFRFDDVLRVESLEQDIARISGLLDVPLVAVRTANRTEYARDAHDIANMGDVRIDDYDPQHVPTYEHFYTPAGARLVREVYRVDFEALARLGVNYPDPCGGAAS